MSRIKDMKLRYKVAAGVATSAAVVGMAGGAFAYWTSSGSGTGTASTDTAQSSTNLAYSNGTISGLAPGVAASTFTATVTNNGSQNAYVAGLTAYLTVAETDAAKAAYGNPTDNTHTAGTSGIYYVCSAADYSLDGNTNADSAHPVSLAWTAVDLGHASGHNTASTAGTDTLGFNDISTQDQGACQGATVTLHYASN